LPVAWFSLGVLLLQAAATWFMTGLIWVVQVVHYPLLAQVGAEGYGAYHARHMRRITWIVGPVMAVEGLTAAALVVWRPAGVAGWEAWVGVAAVVLLAVSTAFVQVPAHERLARGFDGRVHRRLVRGNWIRTVLWTGRGGLVGGMLFGALAAK
jgi:hypothetical protein